jgi:transcriptional regulator with XRE-family HTH domain
MTGFGDRLKGLREAKGWSQERVGFELGVTKATISKWETGRAEPGLENLCKIRRLYRDAGVTLDELIAGEGVPAQFQHGGEPYTAAFLAGIEESGVVYGAGSIRTESTEETHLVVRYRQLRPKQRKGLLALLTDK